jgi:hypothetical protein
VATALKKPAPTLFTLKIELVDSMPLIWRRIVISGHASFATLHHVIQAAMGWHDAHLHEFRVGEQRFCRLARAVHAAGLDWWYMGKGIQVRLGRKNPGSERAIGVLGVIRDAHTEDIRDTRCR